MNKKLLIVSGFSGAGKGSILKALKESRDIEIVRSVTTRPQRSANDYYEFVSVSEFEHRFAVGEFLEANKYTSGYYGTPLKTVLSVLANGHIAVLEIDQNGYRQVLDSGLFQREDIFSIFIAAHAEDLLSRLMERGTENLTQIIKRLEMAVVEVRSIPMYANLIVNQDLKESEQKVCRILSGEIVSDIFDIDVFQKEAVEIIATLKTQIKEEM